MAKLDKEAKLRGGKKKKRNVRGGGRKRKGRTKETEKK